MSRLARSPDGNGKCLDRLVGLVVSLLAAGLLPGGNGKRGLPRALRAGAAVGRAELDGLPVALGGAVRALGGTGAERLPFRCQDAAARPAGPRHLRGARAPTGQAA